MHAYTKLKCVLSYLLFGIDQSSKVLLFHILLECHYFYYFSLLYIKVLLLKYEFGFTSKDLLQSLVNKLFHLR